MHELTAVAPYGADGASARVRVWEWLQWTGVSCRSYDYLGTASSGAGVIARRLASLPAVERDLRTLAGHPIDVLLLHREASPLSRGGLERDLLRAAQLAVYDFDDALQWDAGRGGLARRWAPKSAKCILAVRHADRVIAGSSILADWAAQWAREVVVIPSCVNPGLYPVKADYEMRGAPRLVWIGTPSTEHYLQLVAPALLEVHRRTGARVAVISAGAHHLGELERIVDRVAWQSATYLDQLHRGDIALAPLQDGLLERGKCAYKILQYAAAGLPTVASPVGVNSNVLATLGFHAAASHSDWVESLVELIVASPADRSSRGTTARSAVEAHYSFAAWEPQWRAALDL